MTNVYSFDGIVVFGLLYICTCAYLKKVPRLNSWLLSEKKGVWGVFYKELCFSFTTVKQRGPLLQLHHSLKQRGSLLQLHHSLKQRGPLLQLHHSLK
uniref:Protein kish n=1 Tax=Oncorhynchus tshawytscha TaxID=74940 RepID=A0A8C8HXK2_ONCTS